MTASVLKYAENVLEKYFLLLPWISAPNQCIPLCCYNENAFLGGLRIKTSQFLHSSCSDHTVKQGRNGQSQPLVAKLHKIPGTPRVCQHWPVHQSLLSCWASSCWGRRMKTASRTRRQYKGYFCTVLQCKAWIYLQPCCCSPSSLCSCPPQALPSFSKLLAFL